MQTVDEQPETIHLYVVREKEPKPSVFPIILSALSLIVFLVFCVLVPYQQPVTRAVIRVPAVLLPIRTFTVTTAIIPTGVKVYPATIAHGTLTITNGSVITQVIPAGFTVQNVATDRAVYVPAGSANGYGYAVVPVHALMSGKQAILGLHYPCSEAISSSKMVVHVTLRCQFITYQLPPFMHVTGVSIIGKNLLLTVWYVTHPTRLWVK